ncbi:MAG TPA: hypothetical protein VE007_07190 [Thermoanaerobaculia bacterium]|nr:hypothetical protein [Thermoanaerobaculia bacterium]
MRGAAVVYAGLLTAAIGVVLLIRPARSLGISTRRGAGVVVAVGVLLAAAGASLPARETRVSAAESRLDRFVPVWQFQERHEIRIAAPPERVFEAIRRVRADEIFLFRTLTWIRRGGRSRAPGILDAAGRESLIDVAIHSTFVLLADDSPRELVVGTVIAAPAGTRPKPAAELFLAPPSGLTLAAMNFLVRPDGDRGSILTTETRVFANGARGRRRFAAYWRVIYPGSALIRRMWLRAIRARAMEAGSA